MIVVDRDVSHSLLAHKVVLPLVITEGKSQTHNAVDKAEVDASIPIYGGDVTVVATPTLGCL